jgi:hypothetical protein
LRAPQSKSPLAIRLHDLKVTQSGCVFALNATLDRAIVEEFFNLVKGAGHNAIAS